MYTKAIVDQIMSESRPCPLCLQYGGPQNHEASCPYLFFAATPEGEPDSLSGADVATADVEPLPATPSDVPGTELIGDTRPPEETSFGH